MVEHQSANLDVEGSSPRFVIEKKMFKIDETAKRSQTTRKQRENSETCLFFIPEQSPAKPLATLGNPWQPLATLGASRGIIADS